MKKDHIYIWILVWGLWEPVPSTAIVLQAPGDPTGVVWSKSGRMEASPQDHDSQLEICAQFQFPNGWSSGDEAWTPGAPKKRKTTSSSSTQYHVLRTPSFGKQSWANPRKQNQRWRGRRNHHRFQNLNLIVWSLWWSPKAKTPKNKVKKKPPIGFFYFFLFRAAEYSQKINPAAETLPRKNVCHANFHFWLMDLSIDAWFDTICARREPWDELTSVD